MAHRLVAGAGYGSARWSRWQLDERGIEPHVKLMDKSERKDEALRADFALILKATAMSALAARAEEISSLVLEATRQGDQRRHDDLLRQHDPANLRAQTQVLRERSCTQDRTLHS